MIFDFLRPKKAAPAPRPQSYYSLHIPRCALDWEDDILERMTQNQEPECQEAFKMLVKVIDASFYQ